MGPARADRQRQGVGQVVAEVAEDGVAGGVDLAGREDGQIGQAQHGVEGARRRGVQVIDAGHARPALAVEDGLELLAELVVVVHRRDVEDRLRQVVEIDVAARAAVAIGGDRLQSQPVVGDPFAGQRQALGLDAVGIAGAGVGVIDVGRAGGQFAVAVTGVGIVLHDVAGQAEEQVVGRRPFGAETGGGHVLVVVLVARVQVRAVAVAQVAGDGRRDAELVIEGQLGRGDQVALVVAAVGGADLAFRLVGVDALGDVFDGAADGVAAVQGALRAAQDLDALDVEDVQHRRLRAGDIDVVHIEADAGLEAPQRVLLAHAADEGDQGRVRPARRLQRQAGGGAGQFGDVRRAFLLQLFGREGRDGHRHVLERFVAAAGADDDVVNGGGLLPGRSGLDLGLSRRGHHAKGGARQQGGLHESVHLDPNLVSGPMTLLFSVQ
ncbi:hypothetical protein D3C77_249800 [compost metagenome]